MYAKGNRKQLLSVNLVFMNIHDIPCNEDSDDEDDGITSTYARTHGTSTSTWTQNAKLRHRSNVYRCIRFSVDRVYTEATTYNHMDSEKDNKKAKWRKKRPYRQLTPYALTIRSLVCVLFANIHYVETLTIVCCCFLFNRAANCQLFSYSVLIFCFTFFVLFFFLFR